MTTTDTRVAIGMPVRISEVFGPTFQGEGRHAGQRAAFIRLAGCNLTCSWCDTPYTWDWDRYDYATEVHPSNTAAVAAQVLDMDVPLVVITGGEPLIQARAVRDLARRFNHAGVTVAIETNATRPPLVTLAEDPIQVHYTASPKLENAGMGIPAYNRERLRQLVDAGADVKVVAATVDDLDELSIVVGLAGVPNDRVWVMPEGTSPDQILATARTLADPVLRRGWHLTLRNHVLLWGDERGR